MNKKCKNHKLLLLTELVFCSNPKASEKILLSFCRVKPGWCELLGWPAKTPHHCSTRCTMGGLTWGYSWNVHSYFLASVWLTHGDLKGGFRFIIQMTVHFSRTHTNGREQPIIITSLITQRSPPPTPAYLDINYPDKTSQLCSDASPALAVCLALKSPPEIATVAHKQNQGFSSPSFQLMCLLHGLAGKQSSNCLPAEGKLCISALCAL